MNTELRRLSIAIMGVLSVGAVATSLAWACNPQASLEPLRPDSGPQGTITTVTGKLFRDGPVEIRWKSAGGPLLATAHGPNFSVPVRIPQAPADFYAVIAIAYRPDTTVAGRAAATFEVTSASSPGGGAPPGGGPGGGSSGTTSGSEQGAGGPVGGSSGSTGAGGPGAPSPAGPSNAGPCANRVTPKRARRRSGGKRGLGLLGTAAGDALLGGRGNDRLRGLAGDDCLSGRRGDDRLFGDAGNDRVSGGSGDDRLSGGKGTDRLDAGAGDDRLDAADGEPDILQCGRGRDRARADRADRLIGCESKKVMATGARAAWLARPLAVPLLIESPPSALEDAGGGLPGGW